MCKPTHNSTSSLKVPSNSDEIFCTIVVPTFREKRFKETFDKKDIKSSADLDQLKKDDPFMYYSLPEVKEAAMKGKDVDFSVLGAFPSSHGILISTFCLTRTRFLGLTLMHRVGRAAVIRFSCHFSVT
jgi:hypothetical protein